MASRCRSLSRPTVSLLKDSFIKLTLKTQTCSSLLSTRPVPQLGSLQSLLPLHPAVYSARLTSCLGIDSPQRARSQRASIRD